MACSLVTTNVTHHVNVSKAEGSGGSARFAATERPMARTVAPTARPEPATVVLNRPRETTSGSVPDMVNAELAHRRRAEALARWYVRDDQDANDHVVDHLAVGLERPLHEEVRRLARRAILSNLGPIRPPSFRVVNGSWESTSRRAPTPTPSLPIVSRLLQDR